METALHKIHNDLMPSLCRGRPSVLILLHFSGASNTVDHKMYINDPLKQRFKTALTILKSNLSDHFQWVNISDEMSGSLPLLCGVPQGSLLGPALLAVYVSSLASLLEAHGARYYFNANGTQFYS